MKKLVVATLHHFYSHFRNPLPDEINLEDGYVIKKFDSSILDPVFEFFREGHSQNDQENIKRCKYAVYYEYETDDDGSVIPKDIAANISRLLQALRIVKRTRAVATLIHLNLSDDEIVPTDTLQVVPKPGQEVTYIDDDEDMEQFVDTDADLIIKYFGIIKGLYEAHGGKYHRVLNSLIFFEIAHFNHLYKPRLILLVTSLESLFNTSKEQVGYMIRIRCSYFLEADPDERVKLSKLIKTIYDLRSLFVHGQSTPNRLLSDTDSQKDLLMKAEDLTRKCIKKIFDNDLIQVFDNDNSLSDEFAKLEQGANSRLS